MLGLSTLAFLCVFAQAHAKTDDVGGLCSHVREISRQCFAPSNIGPIGPRGLPGKDAVVDYDAIYSKIRGKCKALERKIEVLEDLLTWYKASNGLFYKVFTEHANYTVARSRCGENGAILASKGIRNPGIQAELLNLVKAGDDNTWIGLTDMAHEGQWVFEDEYVSDLTHANWRSGQPDDYLGNEDCAHYWKSRDWEINDMPCTASIHFLCEKVL